MAKKSLDDFLKSEVIPYLQYQWEGCVFLVLEGGVLLVKSKDELVILLNKFSDFGARIWSFNEIMEHICDASNGNLQYDFEYVSSTFDKVFKDKVGINTDLIRRAKILIYSSIIWRVLLNRDHVARIYSLLDIPQQNYLLIPAEIRQMADDLTDGSKWWLALLADYVAGWPIDAEISLRESFIKIFGEEESSKLNPIIELSNWERKLLLLAIKNKWFSITQFDYDQIYKKTNKSKEFVNQHLNQTLFFQAKKYIDTLWAEKSSLSILKSMGS